MSQTSAKICVHETAAKHNLHKIFPKRQNNDFCRWRRAFRSPENLSGTVENLFAKFKSVVVSNFKFDLNLSRLIVADNSCA